MSHQLQKFTPLRFVSYVAILNIFWTPEGERTTAGLMPLGFFLLFHAEDLKEGIFLFAGPRRPKDE